MNSNTIGCEQAQHLFRDTSVPAPVDVIIENEIVFVCKEGGCIERSQLTERGR